MEIAKPINVGVIIPIKNLCEKLEETFFYTIFLPSFSRTRSRKYENATIKYNFFIGLDEGDLMLQNGNKEKLLSKISEYKDCNAKIIVFDKTMIKGHVTEMWNVLFKAAYEKNNDYFLQCGDDIEFETKEWTSSFIACLKKHGDCGVVGPQSTNGNRAILTQTFVSRVHYEIFQYYFPRPIKNWFCDNWISTAYECNNLCFIQKEHQITNKGGNPRYSIVRNMGWATVLLMPTSIQICNYIQTKNMARFESQTTNPNIQSQIRTKMLGIREEKIEKVKQRVWYVINEIKQKYQKK